jgi:hypothetical protein
MTRSSGIPTIHSEKAMVCYKYYSENEQYCPLPTTNRLSPQADEVGAANCYAHDRSTL